MAASQMLSAALAGSWLGFLSPSFGLSRWGVWSDFDPLAFPTARQLLQMVIQNSKNLVRTISVALQLNLLLKNHLVYKVLLCENIL